MNNYENQIPGVEPINLADNKQEEFKGEISLERKEALEGLDVEVSKITQLIDSGALIDQIDSIEDKQEFSKKLEILVKIGEIVKENYPTITTALLSIGAFIASIESAPQDMGYSMNADARVSVVAASLSAAFLVISGLLHAYKAEKAEQNSSNTRYA